MACPSRIQTKMHPYPADSYNGERKAESPRDCVKTGFDTDDKVTRRKKIVVVAMTKRESKLLVYSLPLLL
jgi:hypothetical protein